MIIKQLLIAFAFYSFILRAIVAVAFTVLSLVGTVVDSNHIKVSMQLSHSWKNTNPADYETAKWKLEYLSLFEENLKIFLRR
ncbi:unnamed protein product [Rhizophagus irregularis]|uniref:Uncharacterized protein n=1 Tax=Rhizophagus irregularis TaxID=588596 RepID=A0A915ZPT3_9GLOM|nr:unnamed protein product [Rhizophagus irregularis]